MSEVEDMGLAKVTAMAAFLIGLGIIMLWMVVEIILPTGASNLFVRLYNDSPVVIVGYEVLMAPGFFLLGLLLIWIAVIGVSQKLLGSRSRFVARIRRGTNGATVAVGILALLVGPLAAKATEFYIMSHGYHKCHDLTDFGVGVYQPGYVRNPWFCADPEEVNARLKADGYHPLKGPT